MIDISSHSPMPIHLIAFARPGSVSIADPSIFTLEPLSINEVNSPNGDFKGEWLYFAWAKSSKKTDRE
jgi:hypothetical protein